MPTPLVHAMTIRISAKEREQLEAIAQHEGEARFSDVIRRLIRKRHRMIFEPTTNKFSVSIPKGSVG